MANVEHPTSVDAHWGLSVLYSCVAKNNKTGGIQRVAGLPIRFGGILVGWMHVRPGGESCTEYGTTNAVCRKS